MMEIFGKMSELLKFKFCRHKKKKKKKKKKGQVIHCDNNVGIDMKYTQYILSTQKKKSQDPIL